MNTTATVTATVTSADGTTMAYDKAGSGPAAILIGGAVPVPVLRSAYERDRGRALPTSRWAAVMCPALVVDGGASPESMRTAADALAALLPDGRRVTIPDQDHGVAPEVIAPVLAEFFGT
jgi:pimeloyl-ACP methyl ester carboxylesterase